MTATDLAQIVGGWATAVGAFLALVAGTIAWVTIQANRHDQQEATANDRFKDYMLLAVANPRLSKPDLIRIKAETEEFERYEWYVGMMLWACDEVLNCTKMTSPWQASVRDHVAVHREYLCSEGFKSQYFKHHGSHLQDIILDVCTEQPANDVRSSSSPG